MRPYSFVLAVANAAAVVIAGQVPQENQSPPSPGHTNNLRWLDLPVYLLALLSVTFSIIESHASCLARCFELTGGAAAACGVGAGSADAVADVEAARDAVRGTQAHTCEARERIMSGWVRCDGGGGRQARVG